MEIIAIANHKGGCGKTTTAVNLAAAMARSGRRTLLIDLDAQGHATLGVGVNPYNREKTIYDKLLNDKAAWSDVIVPTGFAGLDLAPANMRLSGAEIELARRPGREFVLRQQLGLLLGSYQTAIIDCSPSLSILTLNALVACTGLIIPVQTEYYAIEGLKQLIKTIRIVKNCLNPNLKILGLLLTMMESRATLCQDIETQLRDYFGELVFETVIRRTIRLAEAPSRGEPVLQYAPECQGAKDYTALAEEIIYGKKIRTA